MVETRLRLTVPIVRTYRGICLPLAASQRVIQAAVQTRNTSNLQMRQKTSETSSVFSLQSNLMHIQSSSLQTDIFYIFTSKILILYQWFFIFCSAVMQQKHITHSVSHFKRHMLAYENCLCPRISFILSVCDLFQKRSAEPPTLPGWASWSRCRSRRDEGLKFQSLAGSSVLTGGEAVWREGTRSWSQSAKTPQRSPRRGGTLQPGWSRRSPEIQRDTTDYIY